jgi:Flp pilus assembly protein CpaB
VFWIRVRFFLRRFPIGWWVAAFVLAAVTFLTISSLVGRASALATRWGPPVDAVVAARSLPAGAVVASGDVLVRRVPSSMVPAAALRRPPVGRALLAPLARGELVTAGRVAPDGVGGLAALLPEGARALAVPVGPGTPPLRRGDRVDVLATFDGGEPTFAVAEGAGVLAVSGEAKSVTVARTPDEAPRVAFALAEGTVTLALVR